MKLITFLISCVLCLSSCTGDSSSDKKASDKSASVPDNIIFITIDTLRRDRVSLYGYPFETSPFLTELSKKGIVFDNALTVSGQTGPSHTSMFTGHFPFRHGVIENGLKLPENAFSFYKVLESQKIRSKALTAVKFLDGATGFPEGDFYKKKRKKKTDGGLKEGQQNAELMLDRAKKWLAEDNAEDRYFIWLHFFDVHSWEKERHLPDSYKAKIPGAVSEDRYKHWVDGQKMDPKMFKSKDQMQYQLTSYDIRLQYVDEQIKKLYEYVTEKGLNSNTLWVILADHGEGLGNHGYKLHGKYLYQEQLRVPLLFHLAGEKSFKQKRVGRQVSTVDLMPTLAELLKAKLPESYPLDGDSFSECLAEADCSAEADKLSYAERRPKDDTEKRADWLSGDNYSVQNPDSKYIYYSDGKDEFYDLEKDPFELDNLMSGENAEQKTMKDKLVQTFEDSKTTDHKEKKPFSPELVEELQSLGYM